MRSTTPRSAVWKSARGEAPGIGLYVGGERLSWWIEEGQHEQKTKEGGKGVVVRCRPNSTRLPAAAMSAARAFRPPVACRNGNAQPVFVGCDFGSTTAKAVVLSADKEMLVQLLRAVEGQSDRGCQGGVRADRRGGYRADRRTGHDRLRQGSAEGHHRCRRTASSRPSRTPRRRCTIPGCRRDLRRWRRATSRS